MMGLIEGNYMLQFPFHDAEQHFLDWYFKFTRRVPDGWRKSRQSTFQRL